ncbi:MAG: glycosyltransferase family A protein [Bacteroidales bacterium]|nr:glycosyltransferase family A protein [Bacteroidales bacterium]MDD3989167.1 glycosyltransferase family A protein [Bacteroidales bacterium]MDD4639308.1 glycosyltransferase family A protein [Bacteroidales bacterium]
MKWHKKYLEVFEKPFSEASPEVVEKVKKNLAGLQCEEPLASVVVIAYNEEQRLLSCLWSLSENRCSYPVEIFGVDNNSRDKTRDVFEAVGMRYYSETKQSCGHARNRGLSEAKGKYYICIDSDTMYPAEYLERQIRELEKPGVVASSALWSYVTDREYPKLFMFFYELLRDIHLFFQSFKRPELSVRGLVFAYNIEYGKKVGYRVDIIRGEDGSMALGLKKYGKIKFIWSSKARAVTCTATLRSDGSVYKSFTKRVGNSFRNIGIYFRSREIYKDEDSNIVKPKS